MQTGRTADAGHAGDDHAHTVQQPSFRSEQQQHQRHHYYSHGDQQSANASLTVTTNGNVRSLSDATESHDGQSEDGHSDLPHSPLVPAALKFKAHVIGESQQQRISASAYAPNAEPYTTLPPSSHSHVSPSHNVPANTFASYAARAGHLSSSDDRDSGNGNGGNTTPGGLVGITTAMSGATVSSAHHQAHPDQMTVSQQQNSQFMVSASTANHGSTIVAPGIDGTNGIHQHGGNGMQFGSSSVPSYVQSAPPSVTTFAMHPSMQSPTQPHPGAMYPPSYYPPPHTSSAPQSFLFQQQQQQHQGQGQAHNNGYMPSHGQMAPPDGFPSPYFYSQANHPMASYYNVDGKAAPQSEQQQQCQIVPPHHYHPYAGAEGRRAHLRNATPPSMAVGNAPAQGHFVPSQGYRAGGGGGGGATIHPNASPPINAMSIFTANPDNLPDMRFSDQPMNPGSQYGRLPNGKIIELFPAMMRTIQACEYCRSRKAKCTGGLPCERCNKKSIKCEYAQLDKKRKIKTTTSEYDMSLGSGGSSSAPFNGSANARAQALLSAKVGITGNKPKQERGRVSGGSGGGCDSSSSSSNNAALDMQHSFDDKQTFESANSFGVGHWSNDMDDAITQHLPPKFTVPLPSSGNMFEQEGNSSFGSHDSMSLIDARKRPGPSSPAAYSNIKANSPQLGLRVRGRKSSRLALINNKSGDEQGCSNALGLYT